MKTMNEKGYTLLEMLLVLSIFSILLLLPIITIPKLDNTPIDAIAVAEQLKNDLLLAQQVAMATGKQTFFRTDNDKKEYVIRFSLTDVYSRHPYVRDDMHIQFVTLNYTFSFLANGHPSHSGTFILHVGEQKFRFTIYLGKGMIFYQQL